MASQKKYQIVTSATYQKLLSFLCSRNVFSNLFPFIISDGSKILPQNSQYFICLNSCSFFQQHCSSFLHSFPFLEFVVRQSKVFSQTALKNVLSHPGCYSPKKCILYFVCWYGSETKPIMCCNEYKTMKVENLKYSEGVLIPYLICIRNMNLVYSQIIIL